MRKTENLRRQHDDILKIADEISQHLNPNAILRNSNETHLLISRLAGKVKIHLSMEDHSLYPRLLIHKDAKVKNITKTYIKEMGGINSVFTRYLSKWKSPSIIQNDIYSFVNETKNLFDILENRINKENNELYPIIDNAA